MLKGFILLLVGLATVCRADFGPSAFEAYSTGKLELSNTNSLVDIYAITPTAKVFAQNDTGLTNALLVDKLYFHAAGNETEQMQLVIKPTVNLNEVSLSFDSPAGSMAIPTNAWTWYQVEEVYVSDETYWYGVRGYESGMVPDPLEMAEPFSAAANANTVLLLDLQVDSGWPAGVHHCSIGVVTGAVTIATIPVELTVWPITLPAVRSLAVAAPNLVNNNDSLALQTKQLGVTHVKYGASGLTWTYDEPSQMLTVDTSNYEPSMQHWIDQIGLPSIMLPPSLLGTLANLSDNYLGLGITVGSAEFWPVFEQFMTQMEAFYRVNGWENNVVWYMMDEIYSQHYPTVAALAEKAKEIFPELNILLVTDDMPDSLAENIDTWVVPWHFFVTQDDDYKRWDVLRDRGESLFAYMNSLYFFNAEWCLRSMRFFPSVLSKYGYDGCLWWGMTVYGGVDPWVNAKVDFGSGGRAAVGNGYLTYPPSGANTNYSSSLRWENFKQGMDEYEMLEMLQLNYEEVGTALGMQEGLSGNLIRYWGGLLSDGFRLQTYRGYSGSTNYFEGQYIERFRKLLASEIINATNAPLVLADVAFDDTRNVFIIQGTCQTGTVITINGVTPYQSSSEGMVEFSINLPFSSVSNVIAIAADDGTGNSKTLWREGVMMRPSMFSAFSAYGDFVNEKFTTLPPITATKTAAISWVGSSLDEDPYNSAPTSLLLAASGGSSGWAEAYYLWDLCREYDFYYGAAGSATVKVSRDSTALKTRVELLDVNTNVVSSAEHFYSDFSIWHNLDLPLDGDETAVRYIRFANVRSSGTGNMRVNVDDFIATGNLHSPSTILSLSPFTNNVLEMVVDSPTPGSSFPKTRTSLVDGSWGSATHSTNSIGPFAINSLGTMPGTNTIYLEVNDASAFFGIGEK